MLRRGVAPAETYGCYRDRMYVHSHHTHLEFAHVRAHAQSDARVRLGVHHVNRSVFVEIGEILLILIRLFLILSFLLTSSFFISGIFFLSSRFLFLSISLRRADVIASPGKERETRLVERNSETDGRF